MATVAKAACRAGAGLAAAVLAVLLVLQQLCAAGPDPNATEAAQAAIVERALSGLQPASASDRADHLYFVGFAGYGPEAVFKREVMAVQELFKERFGTKGRSVALINHSTTVEQFPLASAQNLERVLQHLGRIMDPGRDTLFLFLTSHGERALLAVEMPGFSLEHLTPAMLRSMLDQSGIRRRIVVVSACHSGSFIPALANATTLVIAAAHADRTSFGCADKREWTYFGDAYFNNALRQETSFRKAFDRAKRLVEQWESVERLVPSLPQIMGGEALTTK
ncbi:MAG: C13 family peptidase [Hyphomonadaceae bacterium]|nr:C13 family peptidase [Hyphomonadaceae bacterium]